MGGLPRWMIAEDWHRGAWSSGSSQLGCFNEFAPDGIPHS
jgi:hypothetical protein